MINTYPLLERISRLQDRHATGVLQLTSPEGGQQLIVYFHDGFINAVYSDNESHRLGQYLLRRELLTETELEKLLTQARKKGVPLGELAVNQGLIEPRALAEALGDQALELFKHAIDERLRIGSFEAMAKAFQFPLHLSGEEVALQFLRSQERQLEFKPGHQFRLNPDKDIRTLPWTPREILILSHLRYPRTVGELAVDTGLPEEEVKKALTLFSEFGLVTRSEGQGRSRMALIARDTLPLEQIIPQVQNPLLHERLEVVHRSHSFASEQFNSIKVHLNGLQAENPVKIVSISSPHVQDGKSLISTNLALCFAKDPGRRVLLLECDLRRPNLDKILGIPQEPGLLHYLLDGELEPQCYVRRVGNLYIMTAGGVAENPVALLSLSRMNDLLAFLRREFDTVIVDSPPLVPVADARIVSKMTDASLLVIRRGKTPYGKIEKAVSALDRHKFAGVVFNDAELPQYNSYYDQYYFYAEQGGQSPVVEMKKKTSRSPLTRLKGNR